jgi:glycerophosphoryl diester phosphodiesterase/GNAT superfamily N-acetyltransferase
MRPIETPWVIAHRGASGVLPEHTLAAYALALEQGADVIEPDLLPSRDGVLHCRHDSGLSRSTDVAWRPAHAKRRRPGVAGVSDWWIEDFTAAELRELRAIQPWPQRPHHRDRVYPIPTFAEVLDLLLLERRRRERAVLVYPELKHPAHYAALGIDLVAALAADIESRGLGGPDSPVWVQCFDLPTLGAVRERLRLKVVWLCAELPDPATPGIDGFGIAKAALAGDAGREFIAAAHAAGKVVHAWTFRDDVPVGSLDPVSEAEQAIRAGIDGLFGDFPATLLRARRRVQRRPATPALRVERVAGAAIAPWLDALAELRIRVFREWPYLYDGDLGYEANYLAAYARSAGSVFVLAIAGDRVVGCATGMPLADAHESFRAPFLAAGIDPREVFYFGESVLDPAWRGHGLGHRFFDEREEHARALGGFRYTAFCAVERDADDPRRPPGYRPLDAFWSARGYRERPDLRTEIEWRELGEAVASPKPMIYWLRSFDHGG